MNGEESHKRGTDSGSSSGSDKDEDRSRTSQSPWIEEVIAIIADISACVSRATLSDNLTSRDPTAPCAYINIETLESRQLCVKLSVRGFSVVGQSFDDKSGEDIVDDGGKTVTTVYETPYALLQSISPLYVEKFSSQLCERLLDLADQVS